jgi:DnaJ family protein A protein 2
MSAGSRSTFFGGPPRQSVDTTGFYTILGVSQTASLTEIRKAFRGLARRQHPDKGGDPEVFKAVTSAYEILVSPEKRRMYDHGGVEAVVQGRVPEDLFGALFGAPPAVTRTRNPRDIQIELVVDLSDIYRGGRHTVRYDQNIPCLGCQGHGGQHPRTCGGCRGRGVIEVLRHIGPGTIQRRRVPCQPCDQTGTILAPADVCPVCLRSGFVSRPAELLVTVVAGTTSGVVLSFRDTGHQYLASEPKGIVVVTIRVAEHPHFVRRGVDLVVTLTISVVEALCGVSSALVHLDGTTYQLRSSPGTVCPDGSVWRLVGLGLVRGVGRGDLFVCFRVHWPEYVSPHIHGAIRTLFVADDRQCADGGTESPTVITFGVETRCHGLPDLEEDSASQPDDPDLQCRQQ